MFDFVLIFRGTKYCLQMSERHAELWGRTFASREDFEPDIEPTGIDVIEVMRGHCISTVGRQDKPKEVQAKLVAKKLKLQWNNRGLATSQEKCIVTKILTLYNKYLKLDQKNEEYRTEAWKENTVVPFKDEIQRPFLIASKAGDDRYLRKNRPTEDGVAHEKVKNYPLLH